jgi:FkbM family methyltransferase
VLIDVIKDVPHIEKKIIDAIKAFSAPIVLFGGGEILWYILIYLRYYGLEPACICDNDPAKQGTVRLGFPVYSYDRMQEKFAPSGGKYHIIVSTGPQYKDAIYAQLAQAHEKNPVWYLRGYEVCGEKINYRYFRENIAKFEEAYAWLADDFSKKVFVNVLNAKLSGDFTLYEQIKKGSEYFDPEVIQLTNHEVLLDVGAYRGDTLAAFVRHTQAKYDAIIAFEPDNKTLAILQGVVSQQRMQKVEIHNKGAWNKHAFLRFHDGRAGSSRVSETSDLKLPGTSIEVDTIDNILAGRRVTYISMDIEGAEHNAILGAEQTIKKWKPIMAVCVYHKREDLFDILLLLKSLVPEYKFYLRHYTDVQTETVLYALYKG